MTAALPATWQPPMTAPSSPVWTADVGTAHEPEPPAAVPPALLPTMPSVASTGRVDWRRFQLPMLGLGALAIGFVALSVMGRPAVQPVTAAPPAPAAAANRTAPAAASPAPTTASAAAASTVVTEIAPTWVVPSRASYGFDGSRTMTLQLAALGEVSAGTMRVRPGLAVRCLARRTDVFVATGIQAKIERGDTHTVAVQFDDEAPTTEQWAGSHSYQELFAPDAIAFAQRLAHARRLRFSFTPYNARAVLADFNVAGFDKLVGNVARTCGWPKAAAAR